MPLASGTDAARPVGTARATLWVARLAPGDTVTLPDDPLQHVFVTGRSRHPRRRWLAEGDAVRIDDEPGHRVAPTTESELMAWTFRR